MTRPVTSSSDSRRVPLLHEDSHDLATARTPGALGPAMIGLALVLVACQSTKGTSAGTALETAADTVADTPTDSGQDGSHSDSGGHADTTDDSPSMPPLPDWTKEPIDPDWRGGDPVPGWEERACPYRVGPDVIHFAYRTEAGCELLVLGTQDTATVLSLATYGPFDSVSRSRGGDFDFPMTLALLSDYEFDNSPAPGNYRGTGWYGPYGTGPHEVYMAVAYTPFDLLLPLPDSHGGPATCIRYVGPDRFQGSLYLDPFAPPGRKNGRSPYPTVTWEVDFGHVYPEHAAQLEDYDYIPNFEYDGADIIYQAGTPYAEAWPWEDITDPGIRSAMFWRYMPANDPRYPESLRRTGVRP